MTYENILPDMLLKRSGGSDHVPEIVSGLTGAGGIMGGLYVSFFKLPLKPVKVVYLDAALSFLPGGLLTGLGQNVWFWYFAGLAASIPSPFINAGFQVILYDRISTDIQGRIFAIRNAVPYATIPAAILSGGAPADYVFEPLMRLDCAIAAFWCKLVGSGSGSGMAVMFLFTGVSAFVTCVMFYKNRWIRQL